jgi:hypothetical protein
MELAITHRSTRFPLRHILTADALTCVAFGVLLVAAAAPLAVLLGLPESLLFIAGLVLLPCAALMALAAKTLHRALVGLVIGGNVAWVVASLAVLALTRPTGFGYAFVLAQAAAVATLAALEWRAARD